MQRMQGDDCNGGRTHQLFKNRGCALEVIQLPARNGVAQIQYKLLSGHVLFEVADSLQRMDGGARNEASKSMCSLQQK